MPLIQELRGRAERQLRRRIRSWRRRPSWLLTGCSRPRPPRGALANESPGGARAPSLPVSAAPAPAAERSPTPPYSQPPGAAGSAMGRTEVANQRAGARRLPLPGCPHPTCRLDVPWGWGWRAPFGPFVWRLQGGCSTAGGFLWRPRVEVLAREPAGFSREGYTAASLPAKPRWQVGNGAPDLSSARSDCAWGGAPGLPPPLASWSSKRRSGVGESPNGVPIGGER